MKLKYYASALVPVCLAAFVFRAAVLILALDPTSGIYISGSLLPILFNGALLVAALFFASALLAKKEPKPTVVRLYRDSLFDVVVGIAGSLFLVGSALNRLITEFAAERLSWGGGLFTAPAFWLLILAALAGLFLIFFVTYPKLSAKQNLWRVLSLSLTVYYLFLLIFSFQNLDVVFSRAFGIYQIIFYGIAAAASINFSKILARLPGRKTFTLFTCLMAVFTAVRFADGVLYLIPENPYAISFELLPFLADCCIAILFVSQMKKLMKGKKRKARPEEESTEPEPTVPSEEMSEPTPADQE